MYDFLNIMFLTYKDHIKILTQNIESKIGKDPKTADIPLQFLPPFTKILLYSILQN